MLKFVCNQDCYCCHAHVLSVTSDSGNAPQSPDAVQAEQKRRSKAREEGQKPASRFEEEPKPRGLLNKYDEEEEEAAMLIGEQGKLRL